MTAAKLSPARARALGLDVPPSAGVTRRRNRRAVPGHGTSRCHDCGETFTSDAAETRHVAPGHCRYETVIT